jgi:TetR/AcrR family fatty acid metabolism transcriptional regulator
MADRLERKEIITARRQKQILNAALAVFARKGFGEATVADVAQEAGTSVGTIYNYYKDKQDLLLSLVTQNIITGNIGEILTSGSTGSRSADEYITAVVEDRLKTGFANVHKIIFLFFEIQRSAKLRRQYSEEVVSPLLQIFESYLQDAVRRGDFREIDEAVISRALVGMIIGIMILLRLEGNSSPYQIARTRELTAELSKLMLYGLKRAPAKEDKAPGRNKSC